MRKPVSLTFTVMTVLFCVCLIVANLMEIKVVPLGGVTLTAGMIVFPISYIINDCLVEVYGFDKARFVIWLGFAMNLLVSILLQIGLLLPGIEGWKGQAAMETVFGAVPRILAASFAAFLAGSMVNAWVMSRMKRRAEERGRGSFSLRAIVSTLWGEGVDSLVFFPIAFAGVVDASTLVGLMVSQALLKTAYEVAVLPLTRIVVRRLKTIEAVTPAA